MNVAALLQDSPSDDRRRQQQQREREQQQQSPPHRSPTHDRILERDRLPPPPPQHIAPYPQQLSPTMHSSPQLHRLVRPHSPPHHPYPPPDYPQRVAHLPPPASFLHDAYDHKHRRPPAEQLPHPHELALHPHHGPSASLGPPGAQAQPYILEHRASASLPPPPRVAPAPHAHTHAHQHQHPHLHHAHTLPTTPSSLYMPPPARPGPMHAASAGPPKLAPAPGSSPPGPGVPSAHTHGSMPLFPTPVGPSMPPLSAGPGLPPRHRTPPPFMDPSPMYGAHPHPHTSQMGGQGSGPATGHRSRGSFDYGVQRETESPAMGSLQRPPSARSFEDRDRDHDRDHDARAPRAPPAVSGAPAGSALPSTTSISMSMGHLPGPGARAGPQTQMLTGPGAVGMSLMSGKDRETQREREARTLPMGIVAEPPGGRRDREREREREREWERREWEREQRERDRLDFRLGHGHVEIIPSDADAEREWRRRQAQQNQSSQWSRFAQPITAPGEDERERERERAIMREMEREREQREHSRYLDLEDTRKREMRELEAEAEKTERVSRTQRGRTSVKEKERAREERRMGRSGGVREELVDERERLARERADRWMMEVDLEREREREQRERESDAMRSRQGQTQTPHHHHHHHHHTPSFSGSSTQGHASSSKSKAEIVTGMISVPPIGVGPGMGPAEIPPFGSIIQDRPQQSGLFRPPKVPNGSSNPSPLVAMPPQQLPHIHPPHPLSHQLSHSHISGLGFPQRRTPPPPFAAQIPVSAGAPSGSALYAPPRSPSPIIPPTVSVPPLHIGTFIFPAIPFPYTEFPNLPSANELPASVVDPEPQEIRTTILMPYGFIPRTRPERPRIWGGAQMPSVYPVPRPFNANGPPALHHRGTRRVYTDDSDLFLCALHAGFITWSGARRARKERRDLRLDLRITKEARFVGGFGSVYRKRKRGIESMLDDTEPDDDGSSLRSAGWGNSHDGAGFEVLHAEFVETGTARSFTRLNRVQRMLEYTSRHLSLNLRKRRLYPEHPDSAIMSSFGIPFGAGVEWNKVSVGSQASPTKPVVVSLGPENEPPSKRSRADSCGEVQRTNPDTVPPTTMVAGVGSGGADTVHVEPPLPESSDIASASAPAATTSSTNEMMAVPVVNISGADR